MSTTSVMDGSYIEEPIVARVSFHVLREERAFHIAKSLFTSADPSGDHIVKPLDLLRLPAQPGDRGPISVAIYQNPGPNYLFRVLDMGPAFYWARQAPGSDRWEADRRDEFHLEPPIGLQNFLDFAIGAAQCLELLHHRHGMVHGEIRGDAFHFNLETNKVKLVSFGSGLRSFEHGLTSSGWSTLSRELGAKNKLLYISPEQTGRMPAEPDSRTDIYSLGVLLWSLLTQQPVFEGKTPLDIVQGVLGRRIPNVTHIRDDVPDVVGRIIQKCTAKVVGERYHSASGLRYDLVKVQRFLGDGDWLALKDWRIASRDVSSFFMLPTIMIGRDKERAELLKVIGRVARSHAMAQKGAGNRFSDGSSLSNDLLDTAEVSSEGGASSGDGGIGSNGNNNNNRRSGSFTATVSSDPRQSRTSFQPSHLAETQTVSGDAISAVGSGPLSARLAAASRPWDRHQSLSFETRSTADSASTEREGPASTSMSARHGLVGAMGPGAPGVGVGGPTSDTASTLSRQLGSVRFRRRGGGCEIVTIEGAGGLGKSCLVQSVMADARRRGYCATAKFDTARRTAYGPLLKLLSALFKQVWGERNTDTPFHQALKTYVRPAWPMLHKVLGLPEFLLGDGSSGGGAAPSVARSASTAASYYHGGNNNNASPSPSKTGSVRPPLRRRGSSPGSASPSSIRKGLKSPVAGGSAATAGTAANNTPSPSGTVGSSAGSQGCQDFLRSGSSTKSIRLMNTILDVLRMFTANKFICFCLEDLHFADEESLELISQIVGARMKMVIIMTYRPDEISPERVQAIIHPPESEGRFRRQ